MNDIPKAIIEVADDIMQALIRQGTAWIGEPPEYNINESIEWRLKRDVIAGVLQDKVNKGIIAALPLPSPRKNVNDW